RYSRDYGRHVCINAKRTCAGGRSGGHFYDGEDTPIRKSRLYGKGDAAGGSGGGRHSRGRAFVQHQLVGRRASGIWRSSSGALGRAQAQSEGNNGGSTTEARDSYRS